MKQISMTDADARVVIRVLASDWAYAAVLSQAAGVPVNNPFRLYYRSRKDADRRIAANDARKVALRRVLVGVVGDLPDVDVDAYVRPYRVPKGHPGPPVRDQYVSKFGRAEMKRLTDDVMRRLG